MGDTTKAGEDLLNRLVGPISKPAGAKAAKGKKKAPARKPAPKAARKPAKKRRG